MNTCNTDFEEAVRRHAASSQYPTRVGNCEKHGDFESRNIFRSLWTSCPDCCEELRKSEEEVAAAKRAEEESAKWFRRLEVSGIPARFRERSFENYMVQIEGQGHALEFARRLADDIAAGTAAGRCAVFTGRPGTGKTHLAAAIATHAMRAGRSALFATVTRLIRRIRDTYKRGSEETESQAIEVFTAPEILVLDEIGVQRGTEDEKMLLFDVLNDRYESRRSTILLSNLSVAEVRTYLGDRVFDRMREDGGKSVVFDWASHRGEVEP